MAEKRVGALETAATHGQADGQAGESGGHAHLRPRAGAAGAGVIHGHRVAVVARRAVGHVGLRRARAARRQTAAGDSAGGGRSRADDARAGVAQADPGEGEKIVVAPIDVAAGYHEGEHVPAFAEASAHKWAALERHER